MEIAMYAVIGVGGKQVRVSPGDTVRVETVPEERGTLVTFDQVLMLGGENGTVVGTPTVPGARVVAKIVDHDRAKKVLTFKKKRRKQYRRTIGHRQNYTAVAIERIETE
jgi:large subunit ribosomal protein L21